MTNEKMVDAMIKEAITNGCRTYGAILAEIEHKVEQLIPQAPAHVVVSTRLESMKTAKTVHMVCRPFYIVQDGRQ